MHVVLVLAVGFGLVGLLAAALGYVRSLLVQYVGNTSAFRMDAGLAHHMIRLPDSWFEARHTGDVMSRFNSTAPIRKFLTTGAFTMLVDVMMAIGSFAMLVAYSWNLTLAVCAFLMIFTVLNLATYPRLRDLEHESITALAHEDSSFIENIERHRAIKLLGLESQRENTWGTRYVDAVNAATRLVRFQVHVGFAGSVIGSVQTATMLVLAAAEVVGGRFTLGMLFAFISYSGIFASRCHALIGAVVQLRMLQLHCERVADIGLEERESGPALLGANHQLAGAVEACGLSFAYGEDDGLVIDKLDFQVGPGEFVAVAGESGTGKTTLVKLLGKLLVTSTGSILVDGINLRELDTASYRRQIGVVMQDDDLFSGSMLDNIAVGGGTPDMARVESAARLACIHDEISQMPMRYLTLVGHMGSTLSGGQRQRVMIARALYREPKLLILDEGTAHLDDALQQRVLNNLANLAITIIAVSHDVRVLDRADRIIRL